MFKVKRRHASQPAQVLDTAVRLSVELRRESACKVDNREPAHG